MIDTGDVEQILGRGYEIEELEHGGQKRVFCVTRVSDLSKFIIKFVKIEEFEEDEHTGDIDKVSLSGEEERTRRELRLMRSVSSPHLSTLAEDVLSETIYVKDGLAHIVFAENYAGSRSLKQLIGENYFDNPDKVKKLMVDMTSALIVYGEFEDGFVHRDIKPGNIIMDDTTGDFVLIDSGIHLLPSSLTITPSNAFVGTTKYASVEQLTQGRRFLDWRSDLFSLGVVSYEAARRMHPFYRRGEASEIGMERHINARYEVIPSENPMSVFNPLWARIMTRHPHSRYPSPNELLLDIERISL